MKKQGHYDSNYSRRQFLSLLGMTGLAFGLSGLTGCADTPQNKAKLLRFYGTGTLDIEEKWKQASKNLGIEVIFKDNNNDTGPIVTSMIQANTAYDYDLGGIQGGPERELALAKKILPWDLSKVPNWNQAWDWVKTLPHCFVDGKQYGLPTVINADSMIYLPDKIGGVVDSYEVIFDPKFKGRTAMEDAWINSVIFTAIYLKENAIMPIGIPGDLTESELGAVMEFLIKKKKEKQFKTFWNGWQNGLDLITSQEVYVMTGWEPIAYAARENKVNAAYALPREGYEAWSNDLIIHIGAQQRNLVDEVHQFANWELGGFYGCAVSAKNGYVVPNDLAVAYAKTDSSFSEEAQVTRNREIQKRFLNSKVYWQNTRPTNYILYEQWWSKLRNT